MVHRRFSTTILTTIVPGSGSFAGFATVPYGL
jgi:hypothetical protein